MPFVTTDDGAEIYYEDTGGDRPAVLLMHGVFTHSGMWAPQVESLAPDYRVVTVDARGHGQTRDPGIPFNSARLAQDHWAVLDHLGVQTVVAGGILQGGWVAMNMALQRKSRVRGLILIGTTAAAYGPAQRAGFENILMGQWVEGTVPLESLCPPIAAAQIGGDRERHREPWLREWVAGDRTRWRLAVRCLIDRKSIEDLVPGITVPALLMRGIGDQVLTNDVMSTLQQQLGGPTQLETIVADGVTHMCTYTHPELTDPLIRKFLDELPA
ncbi:alpha/beta hydrolase [Nocardia sp. NPDC048505]|uniref:alpha/beta fold hydrolase n=1 Tax=unclassified Nocardia TaxID=2637762 RepID=UPI0033FE3541